MEFTSEMFQNHQMGNFEDAMLENKSLVVSVIPFKSMREPYYRREAAVITGVESEKNQSGGRISKRRAGVKIQLINNLRKAVGRG